MTTMNARLLKLLGRASKQNEPAPPPPPGKAPAPAVAKADLVAALVVLGDQVLLQKSPGSGWQPPVATVEAGLLATSAKRALLPMLTGYVNAFPPYDSADGNTTMHLVVLSAGQRGLPHVPGIDSRYFPAAEIDQLEGLEFDKLLLRSAIACAEKDSPTTFHAKRMHLLYSTLPDDIVLVPDWLSVSGGVVYAQPPREANDLDLIVRALQLLPDGARLKLERLFTTVLGKEVHWVEEAAGPNWAYVSMYDLVARKKKDVVLTSLREPQTAGLLYKAAQPAVLAPGTAVTDVPQFGAPLKQWKAAGEFYGGEEDKLWTKFVEPAINQNDPVAVQTKFDGNRMQIQWDGTTLHVFAEKGGERAPVFWGLKDLMPTATPQTAFILDTEAVSFEPNSEPLKAYPRWEMAWMNVGENPPAPYPPVTFFVHDIMFLGKPMTDLPYSERMTAIKTLLGDDTKVKDQFQLAVAPTWWPKDRAELDLALKQAAEGPSSEGAMLKRNSFTYHPERPIPGIVKFKLAIEVDVRVIGFRKVIAPRPANTTWTMEQAMQELPAALERSNVYVARVAIQSVDAWIPLDAEHQLSAGDVKLVWDAERQVWNGTDDPTLWSMCPGFADRQAGEFAFGNTYAFGADEAPVCGLILTAAPMQMRAFAKPDGSTGLTWIFPKIKNTKPVGTEAASLSHIQEAFGPRGLKLPEDAHFQQIAKAETDTNGPKALNPDFFPDENVSHRFVLQMHYRGQTAHADFRCALNGVLEGWSLTISQPEQIGQAITSMSAARDELRKPDNWKFDLRRGLPLVKPVTTTVGGVPKQISRPANVLAVPKKGEIAADWLRVQGVTDAPEPGEQPPVGATRNFPGVFVIFDEGTVEFGARRPWFFEYFLDGKHFDGRYAVRLLNESQAGGGTYWIFMRPIDQTPYVLSPDAIQKKWLPPKGISCLPGRIRTRIPEEYRYWEVEGEEALNRRQTLARDFEELGGPTLGKQADEEIWQDADEPHDPEVFGNVALEELDPDIIAALPANRLQALFTEAKELSLAPNSSAALAGQLKLLATELRRRNLQEGGVRDELAKAQHSRDRCMKCSEPPTTEFLWAEGMAHAWFCDEHAEIFRKQGDIDEEKVCLHGIARKKWGEPSPLTLEKAGLEFVYQRHWWRGQIVIRFGPSSQHYDLLLTDGDKFWHVVTDKDIRQGTALGYFSLMNSASVTTVERKRVNLFELQPAQGPVSIPPNTPENPTKDTPAFIETLAYGSAEWLEDTESVKKLALTGVGDKPIIVTMQRESPDMPFWSVATSTGPATKSDADDEEQPDEPVSKPDLSSLTAIGVKNLSDQQLTYEHWRIHQAYKNVTPTSEGKLDPEDVQRIHRWIASEMGHRKLEHHRSSALDDGTAIAKEEDLPSEKQWIVPIEKIDEEKRLVYGIVVKPNAVDTQGDICTPDEIEAMAHKFMIRSRLIDYQHQMTLPANKAVPVESYIALTDLQWGDKTVPKGSWIMVTYIPDDTLWAEIKAGRIMAYSIRGTGKRIALPQESS